LFAKFSKTESKGEKNKEHKSKSVEIKRVVVNETTKL
jgi:hypothetical protein